MKKLFIFLCILSTISSASKVEACTRVVYSGPQGQVVTGRTMDWKTELYSNFELSLTPNTFWVRLQDIDLEKGVSFLKLPIANDETYSGNAANDFKVAKPFKFMGVKD